MYIYSTFFVTKSVVTGWHAKDKKLVAESFNYFKYGLGQKVCQIISVMKTNMDVFVVFKTKHELKCQNELPLKYHFAENTSFYVFITEIIWQTFVVIIDDP